STSGDANVSSIGTLRSQECSCDVVKEIPSACRHELGLLPLPLAGEGWGGGDQHESCCTPPPCPSPVNGGGDVRAPRLLSRGPRRREPRARPHPRLARCHGRRPTGPRPMLKAPMLLAAVLVVCVASSADARRRHHGYYGYGERSPSSFDDWRRARDTQGQGQ